MLVIPDVFMSYLEILALSIVITLAFWCLCNTKTKVYWYPFLAVLDILSNPVGYLAAPLITPFSFLPPRWLRWVPYVEYIFTDRDGYFPPWLWWFQTPDSNLDGCNGDVGFCARHKSTNVYVRRVLWQFRNTMAGFSHALGTTFTGPLLFRTYGDPRATRNPKWYPGWYLYVVEDLDGRTAFEFTYSKHFYGKYAWNVRVGWKLGNLKRDASEIIPVVFRINPCGSHGVIADDL